MKKILLTFLILITSSVFAVSYESGNDLHSKLIGETIFDKGFSLGYVTGVVDTRFSDCKELKQVQARQLVDSSRLFLIQNPDKRQYTASSIIEFVVKDKYGCK